jgi:hypothetical protein
LGFSTSSGPSQSTVITWGDSLASASGMTVADWDSCCPGVSDMSESWRSRPIACGRSRRASGFLWPGAMGYHRYILLASSFENRVNRRIRERVISSFQGPMHSSAHQGYGLVQSPIKLNGSNVGSVTLPMTVTPLKFGHLSKICEYYFIYQSCAQAEYLDHKILVFYPGLIFYFIMFMRNGQELGKLHRSFRWCPVSVIHQMMIAGLVPKPRSGRKLCMVNLPYIMYV